MGMGKASKKVTRSKVQNSLFGTPQAFIGSSLPTCEDVMRHYKHVAANIKLKQRHLVEPPAKKVASTVASDLEAIWISASITPISRRGIEQAILRYYNKTRSLMKSTCKNKGDKLDKKIRLFKADAQSLFDIAPCKCHQLPQCSCTVPVKENIEGIVRCRCQKLPECTCPPWSLGIPEKEIPFLVDQRNDRNQVILGVDGTETKKLRKKRARHVLENLRREKYFKTQAGGVGSSFIVTDNDANYTVHEKTENNEEDDPEYRQLQSKPISRTRNFMKLPSVSRISERFNTPDNEVAAIASAALQDAGFITRDDKSKVIDRKKISRQRDLYRRQAQEEDAKVFQVQPLRGTYFDGKLDRNTKVKVETGSKIRVVTRKEDHYVLVAMPEEFYLGHVEPKTGEGRVIGEAIVTHITTKKYDTTNFSTVGCDGTPINTGPYNGVIRCIEEYFGRPLQWIICQLHGNELPLRHVILKFDGPTSGAKKFSGVLGKQLDIVLTLTVSRFKKIEVDLPEMDSALLSTDQRYMLDMARAISSGHCSEDLALRDPGEVDHSRWLTTANRFMRLYVGTARPSATLKNIVQVIMKVYVPMWFTIKRQWKCTEGAKHVWRMITLARQLPKKYRDLVNHYIQINAYFAHPENILISMVTDERPHIRRLGIERILQARRIHPESEGIRFFHVPKLNFNAKDYTELIQWEEEAITPPPIFANISSEDLQVILNDDSEGSPRALEVPDFPVHTQSVERHVKMVSEAAASGCGNERRDGNIRQKIKSRQVMPGYKSKKDFRTHN